MEIIDYPTEVQTAARKAFAVDARAGEVFVRLVGWLDTERLTKEQVEQAYVAATNKNREAA